MERSSQLGNGQLMYQQLAGVRYLDTAEAVLGVNSVPPPEVISTLQTAEQPDLVAWSGASTWVTAYIAALRPIAIARAADRARAMRASATRHYDTADFNQRWHETHLSGDAAALLTKLSRQVYATTGPPGSEQTRIGEARWLSVTRAARNVSLANAVHTPKEIPSNAWADREGPRATLQKYFGEVLDWFTHMPPKATEKTTAGRLPVLSNAVLIVGPTAIGKTMIGGDFLARADIGAIRQDGRPRRALWITVTQALIQDCLDPNKTLQRCLGPAVRTTAIWEDHKDAASAEGDLVCASVQSLEEALEVGLISPDDFDVLIFDEAHYALSDRLTQLLQTFDCRKVLLTATPSRSFRRDLLATQHYVRPIGRREAVERGMLSPVRLVTHAAESLEQAEFIAARTAVHQFILQGKKVVIYCKAGKDKEGVSSAQAVRVAELINQLCAQEMGDAYDPAISYAEMVGAARPDSLAVRKNFESQEHGGALTTVQMLGVGWDFVDLSGTIHVGEQTDLVAFEQETGRALRPGADGSEAVLVEITLPIREGRDQIARYCLAQLFGLSEVTGPNVIIGPPRAQAEGRAHRSGRASPPAGQTQSHSGATGETSTGAPETAGEPQLTRQRDDYADRLPSDLAATLIGEGTSIVEIIIAPEKRERYQLLPEYSVVDVDLAATHRLPLSYIHYHLESRTGLPAVGYRQLRRVWLADQDQSTEIYPRYYHADQLAARLQQHPFPEVSDEQIYTVATMGQVLHAPEGTITTAIQDLGLPDRTPTKIAADVGIRTARPVRRYTAEEFRQISDWVERVPLAEPGDQPVYVLARQYPFGIKTLDPSARVTKRHPRSSDRKGTDYFVDADTVAQIAAIDAQRSQELVAVKDIAARVGLTPPSLMRNLTDAEKAVAKSNRFTPPGGTIHAPHVPRDMAAAIEARLTPRGLRPHEVTMLAILARYDLPVTTLGYRLKRANITPSETRRLPGSTTTQAIFGSAVLAWMDANLPLKSGAATIDHERLAAALDEGDVHYARRVQLALGIREEELVVVHEPGPAVAAVASLATAGVVDPPQPGADAAPSVTPVPEPVVEPDGAVQPGATSASASAEQTPPDEPVEQIAPDVAVDKMLSTHRCSIGALEILLHIVDAPAEEVVRGADGELLGCNQNIYQKINHYRIAKKLLKPADGWISLDNFQRNLQVSSENALALVKQAFSDKREMWVRACTMGRGDSARCEVYISGEVYRRLLKAQSRRPAR